MQRMTETTCDVWITEISADICICWHSITCVLVFWKMCNLNLFIESIPKWGELWSMLVSLQQQCQGQKNISKIGSWLWFKIDLKWNMRPWIGPWTRNRTLVEHVRILAYDLKLFLQYHANRDLLTLVLHWWYGKILIFGEDAEGMHRNSWHGFCQVFHKKFKGN